VKERPIIFSGPMVRAILEGRKSMTRRPMKPQPGPADMRWTGNHWEQYLGYPLGHDVPLCPHGQPGDYLWVRESWAGSTEGPLYRADAVRDDSDERDGWWVGETFYPDPLRWRSGRFMPRSVARIVLAVSAVRVEPLQDITEEDALAEGADDFPYMRCGEEDIRGLGPGSLARPRFRALWDDLNKKRGYGWDSNPWVWVISFWRVAP